MQELTSRRLGFGAGFVIVAGVAAANSYQHMRDVALLGHQPELLASTLPLSVDGLLLIASMAMAEDKAQNRHPRAWARFAFWFGAAISVAANIAATAVHFGDPLSIAVSGWPPIALLIAVEIVSRPGRRKIEPAIPQAPAAVTVAELEEPDYPDAPISPAPVGRTRKANKAARVAAGDDEYSERHERRLRRGK